MAGYGGFSAISALNLYFYQGASVVAALKHESVEAAQHELGDCSVDFICDKFYQLHPELRHAGQAETFRFMHQEGSRLVRQHPATYARIHLRGLMTLMLNPGAPDLLMLINRFPRSLVRERPIDSGILAIVRQMHRESPAVLYTNLALAVGLGITYVAAALGLVVSLRRWNWGLAFLILGAGYLLAIAGGPTAIARLRLPAMPLVCVVSGIGIAEVLRWRAGRRRGEASRPDDHRIQQQEAESVVLGTRVESPTPHFLRRPTDSEQSPREPTRQLS